MSDHDFDPYLILGVASNATASEINQAYQKKVLALHPDHNPNDHRATKRFQDLRRAYETLRDPEKRKVWDDTGTASPDEAMDCPICTRAFTLPATALQGVFHCPHCNAELMMPGTEPVTNEPTTNKPATGSSFKPPPPPPIFVVNEASPSTPTRNKRRYRGLAVWAWLWVPLLLVVCGQLGRFATSSAVRTGTNETTPPAEPKGGRVVRSSRSYSDGQLKSLMTGSFRTDANDFAVTFSYPTFTLDPNDSTIWMAGDTGVWELESQHELLTPADRAKGIRILSMRMPTNIVVPIHVEIGIGADGLVEQMVLHALYGVEAGQEKKGVLKRVRQETKLPETRADDPGSLIYFPDENAQRMELQRRARTFGSEGSTMKDTNEATTYSTENPKPPISSGNVAEPATTRPIQIDPLGRLLVASIDFKSRPLRQSGEFQWRGEHGEVWSAKEVDVELRKDGFVGVGLYIKAGGLKLHKGALNGRRAFTVVLWVKPDLNQSNQTFISEYSGEKGILGHLSMANNTLLFATWNKEKKPDNWNNMQWTLQPLPSNEWVMVSVSKAESAINAPATVAVRVGRQQVSEEAFNVNNDKPGYTLFGEKYRGMIDEIRVFDSCLSPEQLDTIAANR